MAESARLVSLRRSSSGDAKTSVAFVIPYGEPELGFFPDTLLEHMCGRARRAGHQAKLLRVFYDGRDGAADDAVRHRFGAWLESERPRVIVMERIFDPEPLLAYRRRHPEVTVVLVSWGDTDPTPGVDYLVGLSPGRARGGETRRSPSAGELVATVDDLLGAVASDSPLERIAGVSRVDGHDLRPGPPSRNLPLPEPIEPLIDHDVIAPGTPPVQTRKHIFGNAGCPYSADPRRTEFHADVSWPEDAGVATLGCTFCHLGGDYQHRSADEVVASLVAQARYYTERLPSVQELVVVDQYPVRYLERLVATAAGAGVRPVRWLFQARADGFTRERDHIASAARTAARLGHRIEVYLSGFESFSDRELDRYNKGVGAEELCAAVQSMRALAVETDGAFEYARARGHSMILWSPWTEPRDIADNVRCVREHGLMELFDEIGRNRLRLYRDLPIHHAAVRDGLVLDDWPPGDEGAGRRKGYSVEQPYRFADRRTHCAYHLALALRERLGRETEIDQLDAIAAWAETLSVDEVADPAAAQTAVWIELERLERELNGLLGASRGARNPGAESVEVAPVRLSGPCNNACAACPNRDRWHGGPEATVRAIAEARATGLPVLFAGREPTLREDFLELVRRAAGADHRPVGVVTNGRRLSVPGFAADARAAGLAFASVKIFAPDEGSADAVARDPGAWRQAGRGALALVAEGIPIEVRAPLHAANLEGFERFAALAVRLDARALRVEASLPAIGLRRLDAAVRAVKRLADASVERGVALHASPLTIGTRWFSRATIGQ